MGAGVSAGNEHLVRGGTAVLTYHVPVTAHERHAKGGMVGRVGRFGREWLRQVIDLRSRRQCFQQPAHETSSRSRRARESVRPSASATSLSVGVKTSFIVESWFGWIAERPTNPWFLPSSVERLSPSSSRTFVYTLCTGPGSPAALVATTSRER